MTATNRRLPNGIVNHIEAELYTYEKTKRRLAEWRQFLIEGGHGRDPIDAGARTKGAISWSDPTYFAASLLCQDRQVREMERIIGAIDDVRADPGLIPEARALLHRRYWLRESLVRIQAELGLSRATVYRLLRGLHVALAARLGWLVDYDTED